MVVVEEKVKVLEYVNKMNLLVEELNNAVRMMMMNLKMVAMDKMMRSKMNSSNQ